MKIPHVQNVGRVLVCWKKTILTLWGTVLVVFFHGPEKKHVLLIFCVFPFASQQAAFAAIHPGGPTGK